MTANRTQSLVNSFGLRFVHLFVVGAVMLHVTARADDIDGWTKQVARGRTLYSDNCVVCHGDALQGASHNPALSGATFAQHWNGKASQDLAAFIAANMPPGQPNLLTGNETGALASYVLSSNGQKSSGLIAVSGETKFESSSRSSGAAADDRPNIFGVDSDVARAASEAIIKRAAVANRVVRDFTPVSEAMLSEPPAGEWLNWRRTRSAHGYSPLQQINTSNVGALRLAWSLSIPGGALETAPLVHDGVMFLSTAGCRLQAIDAATGDFIWDYRYLTPSGDRAAALPNRGIALYGDLIFLETPDAAIVAVDARTGQQRWRAQDADSNEGFVHTGGPVVAHGVVISGLSGCERFKKDPCALVGRDPATGRELWRTSSIAQPGQPGGETWAGLPPEFRAGGDMWIPGSYDPILDTFYVGTAQPKPWSAVARHMSSLDSALYTNSTLAIDPANGKLKWWFQHSPGDSLDLDDVFERVLVDTDGKKVLFTIGKTGILWKLDRVTGKYLSHVETLYQDVISSVDKKGHVTYRADIVNMKLGGVTHSCPSSFGGHNWQAMSYDERSDLLLVPLLQMCSSLKSIPVEFKLGGGGLGGDVPFEDRLDQLQMPGSHGNFAKLAAYDVHSMRERWNYQQKAPFTSASLATAGDLTFIGDADRSFKAFDSRSGKLLWETRLGTSAGGFPVSYSVRGKQYVAVPVGQIGPFMAVTARVGGMYEPPGGNEIYVFELP